MNQKEAVFEEIKKLKGPGAVDRDEPVVLSKQEKAVVQQRLFEGFRKGKIQYNGEKPSDDKLALYISGLVSNWLRKDKRLNGHRNYTPQRPGSRTGYAPPVVATAPTPEDLAAIRQLVGAPEAAAEEIKVFMIRRRSQAQQQHSEESDASHVNS